MCSDELTCAASGTVLTEPQVFCNLEPQVFCNLEPQVFCPGKYLEQTEPQLP